LKNKKKEKRKTMWKNIVEIHSILKEKNYKAKFLTSSILKKVKSTKIILKKKINKKGESWEKRKVILGKKKRKKGKFGKKKMKKKQKSKKKKKKGMHCGLLLL
jgi:hypothetical protein